MNSNSLALNSYTDPDPYCIYFIEKYNFFSVKTSKDDDTEQAVDKEG